MTYDVLTQRPDSGVSEKWEWNTDVIVSTDGTEQRASLRPYPRRQITETLSFENSSDINGMLAMLYGRFQAAFTVPFFHQAAKLKRPASAASKRLYYNPARTDLRAGSKAWLSDSSGGQLLTIDALADDGATTIENITRTFSARALICPSFEMYSGTNAQLSRLPVNTHASIQLTLRETGFMIPFLSDTNSAVLTMFGDYPILDLRPIGEEYPEAYDTGIDILDNQGIVEIRSPWTHNAVAFSRSYMCDRIFDAMAWEFWPKFADYCRGSANPFFMPTFREDLALVAPISAGATSLTAKGRAYADIFYPRASYKQLAIVTAAGTHYTTISGCAVNGDGNSVLTLATAFPAGDGWQARQTAGFLLKARVADDVISCEHSGTLTGISINFRTVDE